LLHSGTSPLTEIDLGTDLGIGTILDLAMLQSRFCLASRLVSLHEGDALAQSSKYAVAWAAKVGGEPLLRTLLQSLADAGQHDERGRSSLLLAATRGHWPCANALMDAGALEREDCQSRKEIDQLLARQQHRQQPFTDDGSAMRERSGPATVSPAVGVQQLEDAAAQDRKASSKRWENTPHERKPWYLYREAPKAPPGPLEHAVLYKSKREVLSNVRKGAPVLLSSNFDEDTGLKANSYTVIDLAMQQRRSHLALQLLGEDGGGEVARASTRAVAWAARDGCTALLKELLKYTADAGQRDEQGRSALLLAASRGHGPCIDALLDAGAWVEERAPQEVHKMVRQWKLAARPGFEHF